MTLVCGYLVGPKGIRPERLSVKQDYWDKYWVSFGRFPPWGSLIHLQYQPDDDMETEDREDFLREVAWLYEKLIGLELEESVKMASTLLSDVFGDYELEFLGREASPYSFEDWLDLIKISNVNVERESAIRSLEVNTMRKGVLAVANIRED